MGPYQKKSFGSCQFGKNWCFVSLVTHQYGHVEFLIFVLIFQPLKKILFQIHNLTRPNQRTFKDIGQPYHLRIKVSQNHSCFFVSQVSLKRGKFEGMRGNVKHKKQTYAGHHGQLRIELFWEPL